MKLEQALRVYDELLRKKRRESESLEKEYMDRTLEVVKEISSVLNELEAKEPPSKVDPTLLKITLRERRAYVSTMRKAIDRLSSMEDLGKRLQELSRIHTGHGRYTLTLFEKDVYRINKLLKELGELYAEYSAKKASIEAGLPELHISEILQEIQTVRAELEQLERELADLKEEKLRLERERTSRVGPGEELLERKRKLELRIRTLETEVRSKASKLQKPMKRMRLPEAEPFLRSSSYVLEHPEDFLNLLEKVKPRLDGKYRKSAEWLLKNLPGKEKEIRELKAEHERLESEVESKAKERRNAEHELAAIEEHLMGIKENVSKLRKRLNSLTEELEKELSVLGKVVGEEVEPPGERFMN
ncbi:DNA repair protein Rad50 [Thermococcus sp. Bubb.Bath]|uniref:DNA repair protein Rad50 n=1 Tax=Thermococcus sp. Bubb.Bath TaxID=1638242 RepID=UPI0014393F9A|nr:DNA repair protein Rad50 [Thermococcus sp. Bubb.Bath]NJF24326.1 DNA repair protein Rad50 [Thermococcus sp. Bubb.Bath]